jgi:hypothetical protein
VKVRDTRSRCCPHRQSHCDILTTVTVAAAGRSGHVAAVVVSGLAGMVNRVFVRAARAAGVEKRSHNPG